MSKQITQDEIVAFLKAQPSFLSEHPELLNTIKLPLSRDENVTDLAAFQAQRLRRQLQKTERRLSIVAQTSLANMQSVQQLHELILGMVRASSLTTLQKSLKTDLQDNMDLKVVKLFTIPSENAPKTQATMPADAIASLFGPNETVAMRTLQTGDAAIYGKQAKGLASDALLLLTNDKLKPIGMLALASDDAERFHEGLGRELLTFFAGVLGACVERLLTK